MYFQTTDTAMMQLCYEIWVGSRNYIKKIWELSTKISTHGSGNLEYEITVLESTNKSTEECFCSVKIDVPYDYTK